VQHKNGGNDGTKSLYATVSQAAASAAESEGSSRAPSAAEAAARLTVM